MDFGALDISASGLSAQRLRMDVISGNMANIETTRRPDGSIGAYKRKNVVFAPILNDSMQGSSSEIGFSGSAPMLKISPNGTPMLQGGISMNDAPHAQGVQVQEIAEDQQNATRLVYDPSHPDANAEGYVEKPNINIVTEMIDMISATRAYEANLTAVNNYKTMVKSTLQL